MQIHSTRAGKGEGTGAEPRRERRMGERTARSQPAGSTCPRTERAGRQAYNCESCTLQIKGIKYSIGWRRLGALVRPLSPRAAASQARDLCAGAGSGDSGREEASYTRKVTCHRPLNMHEKSGRTRTPAQYRRSPWHLIDLQLLRVKSEATYRAPLHTIR